MLIDTHAHLTDQAFSQDGEKVVCDAKNTGVEIIITSGYDIESSIGALAFAEKHDGVYASVGIYPENIAEYDENSEKTLEKLAKNDKIVAIGEIGLQYTDGMPDKYLQKEVFAKQIRLADKLGLPIVIHCREAFGDLIEILKENKQFLNRGGTFHCFCGSLEIAKEAINLGLYISVGGVSTFKNAVRLQEVIRQIPLERIILETDCPYLSPHPYRSKRNEPSRVAVIAENLARLKNISVAEVERVTTENARRLFDI